MESDKATIEDYKKLGLTPEIVRQYLEKIAWRRMMKLEQKGNFDEKYPEDALTAFLVAGKQYFDRELVVQRRLELMSFKPKFFLRNGDAKIFKQRIPGRRYIIGADPASGRTVNNEDTDFCAAVVQDLETGEEYGAFRSRITPDEFAYDLAELGEYFNNAIVAVERTGDGGTTILVLAGECKYSAIYKHKEWHKREKTTIEIEGFPTTVKTRPVALNFLNKQLKSSPELFYDIQFLQEALTFVRDPKGKPTAAPGAHDDTVMCRAICCAARMAVLGYWTPYTTPREDYVSADRITDDEAA